MKTQPTRNVLLEMWRDAESPFDYMMVAWATGLLALFVVGFCGLIYGLFTGQADLQNATFGVFDTLG